MHISDDAVWCVPRAAIWVATRNHGAVTAELFGNGIGPWMNADTWLDEHKDHILPHYQGHFRANAPELARSPFDVASNEVIRAAWNGHLALYDYDGEQVPEGKLRLFQHVSELRNWVAGMRFCLQAKDVLTLWVAPRRGRPRKGLHSKHKDAELIEAVEKLVQTGLSQREACEKLYLTKPKLHSIDATLKQFQRAKKAR